ncbi:dihydroorotase [Thiotrichales bacterium 19S9-12]|nr:dihydroorotase [Thiotrichales bacterium 19S9-11]MCF6811504.1 dihydroorotase [Thiotrichales bacterium 19S9-12]
MTAYLIKNAKIVNEGKSYLSDIKIKNGRIEAIAPNITSSHATIIDALGKYLIPGMIDDQVHFREPGLTHKGDIQSESKAAIAGGITSYMEMPNVNPPTLDMKAIEDKLDRAKYKSLANYAFYLGASNDNLEAIKSANPKKIAGVKVFMGASTGNMLVNNEKVLNDIFAYSPTLIATHCEDTPIIEANEKAYKEKYGEDIPFHYHKDIRSEAACYKSSSLAVKLAKKHNSRLHVLHLTTAKEMELFDNSIPLEEKRITAEACVHHLFFSDNDYEQKGSLIKCNPSIKTLEDRDTLRDAVKSNKIDIIATDHAPHTRDEKNNSYFNAPAGLPLVQHALPSLFELMHQGVFSIEEIVQKTAHNPAIVYQVKDRGFIREGYYADLVLVDPDKVQTVTDGSCFYKCQWSPFSHLDLHGTVQMTMVNGELLYLNGKFIYETPGMALEFDR